MSITNGKQQKRISKKQTNVSTAAVYPIIQADNQHNKHFLNANVDASDPPIVDFDLNSTTHHSKAQCVRGRPATEHTIVSSVAELVSEVIPQGNLQHNSQSEPICWVKIQKCNCDYRGRATTFVVVIGLVRGYQIWTMLENGECEEVASERKGPLRCAHLMPFVTEEVDKFSEYRPLFAMVDGNPMSSDHKHCTMSFLSLRLGKIAHSLDFSEPIIDVDSSSKYLLIVFNEKLVVCDHETLSQRFSIVVPSNDGMSPCYAVSDSLLAFSEFSLDKQKQSCGGVMLDAEFSYGGQIMNAAKSLSKTMASIGESFVSSFSSSQCKKTTGSIDSLNIYDDTGIVSVINVNNLPSSNEKSSLQHYVAHFVAHDTSLIGYISMGNGGNLLLTGAQGSTTFHLFLLHLHPTCVRLSSVQHIYTLHRGNSAAKVLHSAFSADNRWLSISTNHGTTHVYAITPYGGPVNTRTHCGKFVNKESRFQKSAGITSVKQLNAVKSHSSINKTPGRHLIGFREHPALVSLPVTCKTSTNSRLTYYEPPIQLFSLAKLKHRVFSPENWSAWASDNTPSLLGSTIGATGSSGRHHSFHGQHSLTSNGGGMMGNWFSETSNRRMAVAFDASFGSAALGEEVDNYGTTNKNTQLPSLCMYIMNCEGLFTEHKVEIRRETHNHYGNIGNSALSGSTESLTSSTGSNSTTNINSSHRMNQSDTPVRAKISSVMQWILRRNRGASSVEVIDPPLSPSNSLMRLCNKSLEQDSALLDGLASQKNLNAEWLRQVEVITYSGPHRRLWMGPQFSFGVYATSGHLSAQLFNPKDTSSNMGENSTFPSMQKCCPVLIEKNPITINGFANCDSSTSRIVCGSWSSDIVDPRSAIGEYASVKEKIEDAMRETAEPIQKEEPRKKNKKRVPTAKCSTSSSGTNDDLLNLSGMEL